ncbi:MAG: heavy metal translocating P-type ATPase [Alphaproteobacteria bacterium]
MTVGCCPTPDLADVGELLARKDDAMAPGERAVFAVEGLHCAGCIRRVEEALEAEAGITGARVNYTLRRVSVEGQRAAIEPGNVARVLKTVGYGATPFRADAADAAQERDMKRLLLALAVAGFAAMNIMLLSVSVWAGNASDITSETRDLFHWISALIALPAAAIAGRTFYESAFRALAARRLNMDVPITIGVILALGLSVYQTAISAEHAYFESAIMLLFFLLTGRVLEQVMRRKTRTMAGNLAAFRTGTVERVLDQGTSETVAPAMLQAGDTIRLKPGDRAPVDGTIVAGTTDADHSMITGESRPATLGHGDTIYAGAIVLNATVEVVVRAAVGATLIDDVQQLLDKATEVRSRRLDLADRASRLYAPVVHLTAAAAALGWLLAGAGVHQAIVVATTVLIITCPCALALAVPAVQVAASGALFRLGLFLNNGAAIERLAETDVVVFDKTGTLTEPAFTVRNLGAIPDDIVRLAARLAHSSRHPLAVALANHAEDPPLPEARETPGEGVSAVVDGVAALLGRPTFCGLADGDALPDGTASVIAFRHGERTAIFEIDQALRPDARVTVDRLRALGLHPIILSGDRECAVEATATALGIVDHTARLTPAAKIARVEALAKAGHRVVMVGDGLNDAPALAAAHVSISPSSAVDLTQAQADAVFLGRDLKPVADAVETSRTARRLMTQNLAFAAAYNALAIPIAVFGLVTPLIAAVAMSASSLIVTANALRALPRRHAGAPAPAARPVGHEAVA